MSAARFADGETAVAFIEGEITCKTASRPLAVRSRLFAAPYLGGDGP
jgi:hypothetical protein